MSLHLSHVILHQVYKNEQDELVINYRPQPLDNDSATEKLVAELHRIYNAKPSKGFACFKADSEFQFGLKQWRQNQQDFYDFSQHSMQRLVTELAKYPFVHEGILVLADYRSLATHYLFVGLLPLNQSLKITDDLDVSSTDYLDINKMDIAARLDLSDYESSEPSLRYLSYIKGRVGRKIADFFLDFLQAESQFDPKQQNLLLLQALDDFCADAKLEKQEVSQYKKQAFDYCNEQLKAGDEVQMQELSAELPKSQEGVSFLDFTQEQGYELAEQFPADRSTVRKLTKYVGAGGGMNISFDSALMGERVFYDPQTDTLTIKGTPANLRDQLTRQSDN